MITNSLPQILHGQIDCHAPRQVMESVKILMIAYRFSDVQKPDFRSIVEGLIASCVRM